MASSTGRHHDATLRAEAAELLTAHGEAIVTDWNATVTALLSELEPGLLGQVRSSVAQIMERLPAALARQDEALLSEILWKLADVAYDHDLPYVTLSRAMRTLKRCAMQQLVNVVANPDRLRDLCDLVEDEVDEARFQLNRFYTTLNEERIRDSEKLTRLLLNNTHDAILLVDIETGRITLANASAVRLTEIPADELLQGNLLELVREEQVPPLAAALRRVVSLESVKLGELMVVSAKRGLVPTEAQLSLVRFDDKKRLCQVSLRDTSVTQAALQQHQREAAYLRAVVTETADAVVVVNAQNAIIGWNKGAEQIFGWTEEEVLNRDLSILVPPERLESGEMADIAERVERDGFVRNFSTVRVTKDGRRLAVGITRTAIRDPKTDEFLGSSAVVRDFTELRRLERESAQKAQQLSTINRILEATSQTLDRDATFRTIAHELEQAVNCEALFMITPEPHRDSLRVRVLRGDQTVAVGFEAVVPAEESLLGQAIRGCATVQIDDLQQREQPSDFNDPVLDNAGYRSVVVVPLAYQNEVTGALALLSRQPGAFEADDLSVLRQLSGHLAVALSNAGRFEEERKRAAQFELISQVGAAAVANIGDVSRLLLSVVSTIQTDFGYFDVAVYEADPERGVFRLRAHAGHRRGVLGEGYEQPHDVGVFGEVFRTKCSYVANDITADPLFYNPQPDDCAIRSELCVPIRLGDRVYGVLDVESQRPNRFDRLDRAAMEALAGLLARCMEADENLRNTRMLQSVRQNIMEAVPSALIVLNHQMAVEFVNRRFTEFFGQSSDVLMGRPIEEVIPPDLIKQSRLMELIEEMTQTLQPIDLREVRYFDFDGQERYADVRLRLVTEHQTSVVIMLHEATARMKRIYQLSMLQEIGEEMQRSLDIGRLLTAILTCVTAGPGFGFNRAALFLVDRQRGCLIEQMRVGPEDPTQAGEIWGELVHKKTLREFLREYDQGVAGPSRVVSEPTEITIPPDDPMLARWRTPLMLRRSDVADDLPVGRELLRFSGAREVLVVPLVSQAAVLGLIVADNLITGEEISRENIRMLTTFASQAGMALVNAQAYADLQRSLEELRQTQDSLKRAERLSGIGAAAAHVAHEIRNPLVSIGGFARRLLTKAEDPEYVRSRAEIIVSETIRLEQILKNVADFTAPGAPDLGPTQLNRVACQVLEAEAPQLEESATTVVKQLDESLPVIVADAAKLQQVVLNLVRNAIQAMGREGTLTIVSRWHEREGTDAVELSIGDTGPGIPADRLEEIFTPFYTNKAEGTGLGLAVSRKIVTDHGGELLVESQPGAGATFTIRLPAKLADDGSAPSDSQNETRQAAGRRTTP